MFDKRTFAAIACAALLIPSIGAEQGRSAPPASAETKADVSIALMVAGRPYNFSGKAHCTHAPQASIYGTNAQQWMVMHAEDQRSVSLTFWRPVGGPGDMFTLHCMIGDRSCLVSTVKTSGGGTLQGSGKVTFTPSKSGGTFAIDATAANGMTVTGTIRCSAFLPAVDEGG